MNQGPSKRYNEITDTRNRRVDIKTIERESTKKCCPKCNLQGIKSVLSLFQINDQEALLMCKNVDCTYIPSSSNLESCVVKRDLAQLTIRKKRARCSSSASSVSSYYSYCTTAQSDCGSHISVSSRSVDTENSLQHICRPGGLASSKNCLLPLTPAPEVRERRSLVPFAAFPAGHAHNFYSFQTSKIERLKKRRLIDPERDQIKKLDLGDLTQTDIKRSATTAFESIAQLACDSDVSKVKIIKRLTNPSGVLKQRIFQDRQTKEKNLDIRPVGLLEDFLKDYSPAPTPESGKSHIAAINEQLFKRVSSVPSELTDVKFSTASVSDSVKEHFTPEAHHLETGDKGNLESLFLNNREQLKDVSELDEFYINNFEDF